MFLLKPLLYELYLVLVEDNINVSCLFFLRPQNNALNVVLYFFDRMQYIMKLVAAFTVTRKLNMLPRAARKRFVIVLYCPQLELITAVDVLRGQVFRLVEVAIDQEGSGRRLAD
jgi:hypothetical protein